MQTSEPTNKDVSLSLTTAPLKVSGASKHLADLAVRLQVVLPGEPLLAAAADKLFDSGVGGAVVGEAVLGVEAFAAVLAHEGSQPSVDRKVALQGSLLEEAFPAVLALVRFVLGVLLPHVAPQGGPADELLVTVVAAVAFDFEVVQSDVVSHVALGQEAFAAVLAVVLVAGHALVDHFDVAAAGVLVLEDLLAQHAGEPHLGPLPIRFHVLLAAVLLPVGLHHRSIRTPQPAFETLISFSVLRPNVFGARGVLVEAIDRFKLGSTNAAEDWPAFVSPAVVFVGLDVLEGQEAVAADMGDVVLVVVGPEGGVGAVQLFAAQSAVVEPHVHQLTLAVVGVTVDVPLQRLQPRCVLVADEAEASFLCLVDAEDVQIQLVYPVKFTPAAFALHGTETARFLLMLPMLLGRLELFLAHPALVVRVTVQSLLPVLRFRHRRSCWGWLGGLQWVSMTHAVAGTC